MKTKQKSSWGGARKGAGPKLKGNSPRKIISLSIDDKALKTLDEKRGELSRGDFIAVMLTSLTEFR